MADARMIRMVAVAISSRNVTPRAPRSATAPLRTVLGRLAPKVGRKLDPEARGAGVGPGAEPDPVDGEEVLGALDPLEEAHELIVGALDREQDFDSREVRPLDVLELVGAGARFQPRLRGHAVDVLEERDQLSPAAHYKLAVEARSVRRVGANGFRLAPQHGVGLALPRELLPHLFRAGGGALDLKRAGQRVGSQDQPIQPKQREHRQQEPPPETSLGERAHGSAPAPRAPSGDRSPGETFGGSGAAGGYFIL